MQWQRGTRYLGKRRQRNHRRIAFGSITGLVSGFVLTLAVSLVVLGAADGEAGLRLSIPGTKHQPAAADEGVTSKNTSDVAAAPGTTPSVDVAGSAPATAPGPARTGSSSPAGAGASHPATSRSGQPTAVATRQRPSAKPTGGTTPGTPPSVPASSAVPTVPATPATTQASPPPEPSASASEPAADPPAPATGG